MGRKDLFDKYALFEILDTARKEGETNRSRQLLIKGLFGQYILKGQEYSYLELAFNQVYDHRMNEWFQKMINVYILEYFKKKNLVL